MYIYKSALSCTDFLKNTDEPLAKRYVECIDDMCNGYRDTPILSLPLSKFVLYDETGNRDIFQHDYYARRRRMAAFALRVWLYGKAEDIKELEDILWAVCDEYTWALPAHVSGILDDPGISENIIDLYAAETAHSISEILSLCGEYLHDIVVRRCAGEVMRRVIEPFESEDLRRYRLDWEFGGNNWSAVCGGSIGMAAIYLIENGDRLKKLICRAKNSCNKFFGNCKQDGSWEEGVSYWMYAMQYYVAFDELYREVTGSSIVPDESKMKNVAEFPAKVCLPGGQQITFSDFTEVNMRFGIMCKLHARYGVSIPDKYYYNNFIDRCAHFGAAVRNIAWFDPLCLTKGSAIGDAFFPEGQWAVIRRADNVVAIKGGHNGESHNHNDIGSFMYIKAGRVLLDDIGAPNYDKDYFGDKRYEFINAGSHGHSVPIVNGARQCTGKEFGADLFKKTDKGVEVSFASAYDEASGIKTLVRTLDVDKEAEKIIIKDRFEFIKEDNIVKERIITKYNATAEGGQVVLTDGDTQIGIVEFQPEGKIKIIADEYKVRNAEGDDTPDAVLAQRINIIEFETKANSKNLEVCYTAY